MSRKHGATRRRQERKAERKGKPMQPTIDTAKREPRCKEFPELLEQREEPCFDFAPPLRPYRDEFLKENYND
jgi:hypothetical protein